MVWDFYSIVMQVIVVLVIFGQIFVAIKIILDSDGFEKVVRMAAVSGGLLIFLGSKAFNVTFADLMFAAVTDSSYIEIITYATLLPILVGCIVAQATISAMKLDEDRAIRIVLLITVLMLSQISYFNLFAIAKTSLPIDKALLPNLCYSVSICLWVVFRYKDNNQVSTYYRG